MRVFSSRAFIFIPILLFGLSISVPALGGQEESEEGVFDVFFMGEKVGYEEYIWESKEQEYLLTVRGRMTKPIPMVIEKLTIRLDKSFIASQYYFKGSVSGVEQEILSVINEGTVENIILVAGQEQKREVEIRRDALLLPNAVYSPYIVLTKRFPCTLQEKTELSVYSIPQVETPVTMVPSEFNPCHFILEMSGSEIHVGTDEDGNLNSLEIPLKNLRVVRVSDR
ncbi:MAG TPA: hypothetical protein VMW92_03980 [Candidatus Heimdallarchaeota archaeon]|nr:hypothetical protein [Candidatus Heimdallarchaeota archaeon]